MDVQLRNRIYAWFVEHGRAPSADEVGADEAALRRLHDAHALVLDGDAIRMANPFSAVPTAYRVDAGGRSWFANCAWDAFGICVLFGGDGRIEHRDLTVEVRGCRPDDTTLVFHCLVPAAHWWDDIVHT
jgi:hypothetical protein